MKTKREIENRLQKIKSDERLKYPPASVRTNPLLALAQVELEAEISSLEWVLEDRNSNKNK